MVFLTADHAVAPVPQMLIDKKLPGGYLFLDKKLEELRQLCVANYKTDLIAEKLKKDLIGKIIIQFIIEKDGNFNEIVVLKDLGFGTGEEAVRMLKSAPMMFKPGKQRGIPVRTRYILPIALRITAQ